MFWVVHDWCSTPNHCMKYRQCTSLWFQMFDSRGGLHFEGVAPETCVGASQEVSFVSVFLLEKKTHKHQHYTTITLYIVS